MTRYLYSIAIQAGRQNRNGFYVEVQAMLALAASDEEARGIGFQTANELWPSSAGWLRPGVSIACATDAIIAQHGK